MPSKSDTQPKKKTSQSIFPPCKVLFLVIYSFIGLQFLCPLNNLLKIFHAGFKYLQILFIYQMGNVQKKQIRFLLVLQRYFPKMHFHSLQMSIFLSIVNFFREYISTPEKSEITTSRKKSGCLTVQL